MTFWTSALGAIRCRLPQRLDKRGIISEHPLLPPEMRQSRYFYSPFVAGR
jgi:hypothetical protein